MWHYAWADPVKVVGTSAVDETFEIACIRKSLKCEPAELAGHETLSASIQGADVEGAVGNVGG